MARYEDTFLDKGARLLALPPSLGLARGRVVRGTYGTYGTVPWYQLLGRDTGTGTQDDAGTHGGQLRNICAYRLRQPIDNGTSTSVYNRPRRSSTYLGVRYTQPFQTNRALAGLVVLVAIWTGCRGG